VATILPHVGGLLGCTPNNIEVLERSMVQAGLVDTASCICDKLVAQDPAMPWTVLARPTANAPGRRASTERPARVVSLLLPAQCLRRAALLQRECRPR